MQNLPQVSETTIRQHTTAESFSRGQQYYQQGAVTELVQRGSQITALVEGSQYEPYRVTITCDVGGVTAATCTCPYDYGGWCKHIAAVLLTTLYQPDEVIARPPFEEQLVGLDRDQLVALLLGLADSSPAIADALDRQLTLAQVTPAAQAVSSTQTASVRRTAIDTQSVRRQVRSLLRPSRYEYGGYGYASGLVSEMHNITAQVRDFLDGGDGATALSLLDAITDEYSQSWYEFDDSDGELGGFFDDLGALWAEALLSVDLSEDERDEWSGRLEDWKYEADDYGAGDGFAIAIRAAGEGWDDSALVRVLRGESTTLAIDPEDTEDEELVAIRLQVLERQGRTQEYLRLAAAAGQFRLQALMLTRLGRNGEALAIAMGLFRSADDALALAQLLRERGDYDAAIQIAAQGLTLDEPRGPLGTWLAEFAEGLGRRDLALHAAEGAFRSAPSLELYRKLRDLAGSAWPGLQPALIQHLRTMTNDWLYRSARIDVFLHEGLIDDAIKIVSSGMGYSDLERVMDAAIPTRPDWVIGAAKTQAERIMDAGKADAYHHAAEWLRRARDAYRAAARQAEWSSYLADLQAKHGRKYKLMGLLTQL